jgi:hypothetical protein
MVILKHTHNAKILINVFKDQLVLFYFKIMVLVFIKVYA